MVQAVNRYGANSLVARSGWTLGRRDSRDLTVSSAVFRRFTTSTEPASVTFGISGSPGVHMAGGMSAYLGVDASDPVDASPAMPRR